jgi:hypothetical protein
LYENLWTNKEQEIFKLADNNENINPLPLQELLVVLKHFKNKKTPSSVGITQN